MTCLFKQYLKWLFSIFKRNLFCYFKNTAGFCFVSFLSSEMTVISQKLTLTGLWRGQHVTMMVTQPEKPCLAQD